MPEKKSVPPVEKTAVSAFFSEKIFSVPENVSPKNFTASFAVNFRKADTIISPTPTADRPIIVTPAFKTVPAVPRATVRIQTILETECAATAKPG